MQQIQFLFRHERVKIRPQSKEAVVKNLGSGELVSIHYNMLHVTPPMNAPNFIARSSLADKDGWVEVDKYMLRHTQFANVFSLGCRPRKPELPTASTPRWS